MITTGCESCCFLQQDDQGGKGCALGQMCAFKDGEVFAHGYCRMCRSHGWRAKQGTTDIAELLKKILEERALKFDMLVFFDETINTIEHLKRTLASDWYIKYAQKVIIADVTGFGERKNLALQYLKSKEHSVPIIIDSSVAPESISQREETIRRLSKQVTAPFFLAIPAGNIIINFDSLAQKVQHFISRVIHWAFPLHVGNTLIVPNQLISGLFITKPYVAITKSPEIKSFTEQLKREEVETEMGLSWLCGDNWMV